MFYLTSNTTILTAFSSCRVIRRIPFLQASINALLESQEQQQESMHFAAHDQIDKIVWHLNRGLQNSSVPEECLLGFQILQGVLNFVASSLMFKRSNFSDALAFARISVQV